MTQDLTGRRALVTGGGTGIGRATALALARAGADVALTYRSHDGSPVAAEIEALGRRSGAFALDATDQAEVDTVIAAAAEALGGPIDLLVNNAGGLVGRQTLAEMTDEHWFAVIDVNLTSTFRVTRAVLQQCPTGAGSSRSARRRGRTVAATVPWPTPRRSPRWTVSRVDWPRSSARAGSP